MTRERESAHTVGRNTGCSRLGGVAVGPVEDPRAFSRRSTEAHCAHLLKEDLVAASQQVKIPVAPGGGNVVRMRRRAGTNQ
jgi:hypothetical protein